MLIGVCGGKMSVDTLILCLKGLSFTRRDLCWEELSRRLSYRKPWVCKAASGSASICTTGSRAKHHGREVLSLCGISARIRYKAVAATLGDNGRVE